MPKTAVLRSFVLSHIIHHRGQLSVYLRLLDVPVPVDLRAERRRTGLLRRRSLAVGGVGSRRLFVLLATANGAGYRYGVSDQAFYIPGRRPLARSRAVSRATRR